jgi:alginate O-acetyltransferase complex protein AlgI
VNVASLSFLSACAVAAVVFQLLAQVSARRIVFCLLNVAFLYTLVPNGRSWICIGLFLVGTWLLIYLAKRGISRWVMGLGILAVLITFVIVKQYSFAQFLLPTTRLWENVRVIELVGLSYMLFKFIHVFVDQAEGQLAQIGFFSYANYQFAFFTLLAGPIQRYNDFEQSWNHMDLGTPDDEADTLRAWGRILIGMVKMVGIAPLAWEMFKESKERMGPQFEVFSFNDFTSYFYAYPIFMYFNFSGYTDIAIGAGRLFGFRVPENFNHPYLARSVIDFWNRWHMSLTSWIRDYVFMTSYKAAAERFGGAAKYFGYGLLFLALFLAGVWHGSTYGFAIFGAINGLGAAVNQIYGDILRSRLGRAGFQRYLKNTWIELVAITVTLHYFCFSMLFFSSGLQPALCLIRMGLVHIQDLELRPASAGLELGTILLLSIVTLALLLWYYKGLLFTLCDRIILRTTGATSSLYKTVLVGTVFVVLLCLIQWIVADKDPVVAYMRF